MISVKNELALASVFSEESENEQTFNGFSGSEVDKENTMDDDDDDEAQSEHILKKRAKPKRSSGTQPFRLRVALRSSQSAYDDNDGNEEVVDEKRTFKRGLKRARSTSRAKKTRSDEFEADNEDAEVAQPPPAEEQGSDSAEDTADSFLAKRKQNIMANKAMLAQLMADLQKMPGGAGFLKKQEAKQKTKGKTSRPPRSGGESRRNPERASRRLTRSMGGVEEPLSPKKEELELSLEDELLEVRRAPQRRGAPRPKQCKPHIIRPVEDITEDELQLVAENMTDKVYNTVTGSTCHQCRQKTIDTKTCCRSEDCRGIQGQFCGPCLRNRYGEDVKKALLDPEWRCPPCRGICNCSFCRQRDGRCPTGILFPLAQFHGFSDVHSYLTSLRNKLKGEDDVEM